MTLAELLRPEAVKVLSTVSSKKRLLHNLCDLVAGVYGIDESVAVEALMERESLGPTGVGHGVALPHARISGLEDVIGAFVLLEKPVDFDAVDRQPVDLAFALFAPEDAGVEHLKSLAAVARTLRDSNVRAKLRANRDAAALHAILTDGQSVQAA